MLYKFVVILGLCAGKRGQAANRTGQQIDTEDREAIEGRKDTVETEDQLATGQEWGISEEVAAAGNTNNVVIVDIE